MNSANQVGEIFAAAGAAFHKLGDLTTQLQASSNSTVNRWTQEEIDMLRQVVNDFAEGLQKLSEHIKLRTVNQIRNALRKRAFEEAGLPVAYVPPTIHIHHQQTMIIPSLIGKRRPPSPVVESEPEENTIPKKDMTLNMLNAPDSEVEDLHDENRLQFDSSNDEDDLL